MILFYILNASLCCCYRYYDSFLPFLLEACNDEYPDVRQVHCPCLFYYILMLLIQFWDVIETLSHKTIKFLCRLLFMVLVFVLSLVDLFSNPLLEVSCTIPFSYLLCVWVRVSLGFSLLSSILNLMIFLWIEVDSWVSVWLTKAPEPKNRKHHLKSKVICITGTNRFKI